MTFSFYRPVRSNFCRTKSLESSEWSESSESSELSESPEPLQSQESLESSESSEPSVVRVARVARFNEIYLLLFEVQFKFNGDKQALVLVCKNQLYVLARVKSFSDSRGAAFVYD